MPENFLKVISEELNSVENLIADKLSSQYAEIKPLIEHSLKKKGKMLRPAFAVLFGKMTGVEDEKSVKVGATVELLHNSTLIHDDVIDNADIRRGQKTHNSIWDNTLTVLYGDFMFATAMNIAVELENIEVLRRIAGVSKSLVTGELLQNANAFNFPPKKETYFEIIKLKTAVLFEQSCAIPVVLSGKSQLVEFAEKFGLQLGLAFQIVDDCLDFKADIKKLGKPKLIDLPEGKATYPVLLALENGEQEVVEIVEKVFYSKGEKFEEKDKKRLVKILKSGGYLKKAFDYARQLIRDNLRLLENFEDGVYRETLLKICDFIIDREF